jgi:hypothetical protein
VDDRRHKEGDEAREGYFYRFHFYANDYSELTEVIDWMKEHLEPTAKYTRTSHTDIEFHYGLRVILKNSSDASFTRLHW